MPLQSLHEKTQHDWTASLSALNMEHLVSFLSVTSLS
jgi:hypothetical protein